MEQMVQQNENRCRYCRQVVLGLGICPCGGRLIDKTIWNTNPRRQRRVEKGRGGYPLHKKIVVKKIINIKKIKIK